MVLYARQESAFGPLLLRARDGRLTGLWFADQPHSPAIESTWRRDDSAEIFAQTIRQIAEFAQGTRRTFDVPHALSGSPFQMLVWQSIAVIPFGETRTCSDLAERVGAFPRAIDLAACNNPLCLVVPCHRVVDTDGALTGCTGGSERKAKLLDFEHARSLQVAAKC